MSRYLDVDNLDRQISVGGGGRAGRGGPAGRRLGAGSGPTSTCGRSRCSAGSAGSPGTSTGPAARRSPRTTWRPWEFDVLAALRRAGRPYLLSPGQLLTQTHGDLRHDDQPDRPAGGSRAWCSGCPTHTTAAGCGCGSPPRGKERVDAALADLLDRERELLAALGRPAGGAVRPAPPAGRAVRGVAERCAARRSSDRRRRREIDARRAGRRQPALDQDRHGVARVDLARRSGRPRRSPARPARRRTGTGASGRSRTERQRRPTSASGLSATPGSSAVSRSTTAPAPTRSS